MEAIKTVLNELNEKYKRNTGLSGQDSEKMINAIVELFSNSKSWNDGFDYIMNCPPEIGTQAYINFYRTLDRDGQKQFNNQFMQNKQFEKNAQNKAVYRGAALVGRMLEQNCPAGHMVYILRHVCSHAYNNTKKEISIQNIRYIQKEIIVRLNRELLDIKLSGFSISDRDFFFLQRVLIYAAFMPNDKLEITALSQYVVLKWLLESGKKVYFELNEKDLFVDTFKNWPEEIKSAFIQDAALMDLCRGFVNELDKSGVEKSQRGSDAEELKKAAESIRKADSDATGKTQRAEDNNIKDKTEDNNITDKTTDNNSTDKTAHMEKTDNVRDMLKKVVSYMDSLEKKLNDKSVESKDIMIDLNVTKARLAQEEEKSMELSRQLESLEQTVKSLNSNMGDLKVLLGTRDDEIERLKKSEGEYKNNLQMMHGVRSREDSSSLMEFKNILSSKLKYEYMDFREIERVEMTQDIGENLRIQLVKIFNELRKQGINLE